MTILEDERREARGERREARGERRESKRGAGKTRNKDEIRLQGQGIGRVRTSTSIGASVTDNQAVVH